MSDGFLPLLYAHVALTLLGSNEHGRFAGDGRFVAIQSASSEGAVNTLLGIDGTSKTYERNRWMRWILMGER